MRGPQRLLIIGDAPFGAAAARSLPEFEHVAVSAALAKSFQPGARHFDGVLIEVTPGHEFVRAISESRRRLPGARIVAAGMPFDEPQMRQALQTGLDDYVILPLQDGELARAFAWPQAAGATRLISSGPTLDELLDLGDVLKHLGAGPRATAERFIELLQDAFRAEFAAARLDQLAVAVGTAGETVLSEPIVRDGEVAGVLALGRSRAGAYSATMASRLSEYARLFEIVISQAQEREAWERLASRDELTDLLNRRAFERRVDERLRAAMARQERVPLVFLRVDEFEAFERRHGASAAEELLREVALLLQAHMRTGDLLARLDHAEFAHALLPDEPARVAGSRPLQSYVAYCERFRGPAESAANRWIGRVIGETVTLSGGVAVFPGDGTGAAELLETARADVNPSPQRRLMLTMQA